MSSTTNKRVVFIDYLRVIACFMVMVVHSCEPFYLGGEGTLLANRTNAVMATLIDSFLRPCVPLFVIASSYLLFPVSTDAATFYKKRAVRVLVPFLVWLVLYSVIPMYGSLYEFYKTGSVLANLKNMVLNFPGAAGHLWFVYMILGIYLVMPIFSPWIEKVSRKGEEAFLGLWLFTTLIPFFRLLSQSLSGIPTVWGEANWNEFGTFYYVSGFIGYVVFGHYMRTWVPELSWKKTLLVALRMIIVGYAVTAGWFWAVMPKDFPFEGPIDVAVHMETSWCFCTTGVVLMTIGMFLIIRKFNASGWAYEKIILPISRCSYGMYLMHIFFLSYFTATFQKLFIDPAAPSYGALAAVILLTAVCTYVSSFVTSFILSKIPKVGKYIVG